MDYALLKKFDGIGGKAEAYLTGLYLYYKLGPLGAKRYLAGAILEQRRREVELLKEQRDLLRRERDLLLKAAGRCNWSGSLINGKGGDNAEV